MKKRKKLNSIGQDGWISKGWKSKVWSNCELPTRWECSSCKMVIYWTMLNVVDSGEPVCPQCDEDMKLDKNY